MEIEKGDKIVLVSGKKGEFVSFFFFNKPQEDFVFQTTWISRNSLHNHKCLTHINVNLLLDK